MKKKGFTLIATPIILNVVEDAKDSAAKTEAAMIVSGVNNYCAASTTGGTLPTSFSYTKEVNGVTVLTAARLLTVQELKNSCNTTIIAEDEIEISGCNYLLKNTSFANPTLSANSSFVQGYWLENPLASNDYAAWDFNANVSKLYAVYGDVEPENTSVRPVIEVLKTDMDY